MASHKNQHFVPRCYLKPFSLNGEGLAINMYNIDRRKGIRNAALASQCSAAYFYGEDLTLEKLLQTPEGWYAQVLKEIRTPGYRLTTDHKSSLRLFTLLQYRRTEAAAMYIAQSMNETLDIAYRGADRVPEGERPSLKDAMQLGIHTFLQTARGLDDLKVCLIRNKTHGEFITSDDPAIMTNRWYLTNAKAKPHSAGMASAGALFFLPLTPTILCVIYDGDVYSIPNDAGWVDVYKQGDINAFNEHQYLNCVANVYFSGWKLLGVIESEFLAALPHRVFPKQQLEVAVIENEDEWGETYKTVSREEAALAARKMIRMTHMFARPTRWPSPIKWRDKPKIYFNGSSVGFLRRRHAEHCGIGALTPFRKI